MLDLASGILFIPVSIALLAVLFGRSLSNGAGFILSLFPVASKKKVVVIYYATHTVTVFLLGILFLGIWKGEYRAEDVALFMTYAKEFPSFIKGCPCLFLAVAALTCMCQTTKALCHILSGGSTTGTDEPSDPE